MSGRWVPPERRGNCWRKGVGDTVRGSEGWRGRNRIGNERKREKKEKDWEWERDRRKKIGNERKIEGKRLGMGER